MFSNILHTSKTIPFSETAKHHCREKLWMLTAVLPGLLDNVAIHYSLLKCLI